MNYQNFKLFCKQCPFAPKGNISRWKKLDLIFVSVFFTIFVLFYRRLSNAFIQKKLKYTLGIVAIAKNESEYIQEWCAFHKAVGVDVIYLYDNESFDDMKDKLKPFVDTGFVKYHYVVGRAKQVSTYNLALKTYKNECKYLAFIDCDEYLYSMDKKKGLKKSLDSFFKHNLKAGGLALNWVMYGDNGHEKTPEGMCIENFTKRALFGKYGTKMVKTIVNSRNAVDMKNAHVANYKWGLEAYDLDGNIVPTWYHLINDYSTIRLNHYFCKSIEQWHKRRNLGDVAEADPQKIRSLSDFYNHNNNDVTDISILSYLPETKEVLHSIVG